MARVIVCDAGLGPCFRLVFASYLSYLCCVFLLFPPSLLASFSISPLHSFRAVARVSASRSPLQSESHSPSFLCCRPFLLLLLVLDCIAFVIIPTYATAIRYLCLLLVSSPFLLRILISVITTYWYTPAKEKVLYNWISPCSETVYMKNSNLLFILLIGCRVRRWWR